MLHTYSFNHDKSISVVSNSIMRVGIIVGFLIILGVSASPAQIYVDSSATGERDGTSWDDAYTELQSALAKAEGQEQVEVWVAAGTYIPSEPTDPDDERTDTFNIPDSTTILGGFDGDESDKSERDNNPSTNGTVLSGDIGTEGFEGDNAYHIVTAIDVNSAAVLDGFTIQNGRADGSHPHYWGAGIRAKSASPTLRNLIIKDNYASLGGGGAMLNTSSSYVYNVEFKNNEGRDGGGLEADGNITLVDVIFTGNSGRDGGGARINAGNAYLSNVVFSNNSSTAKGGGLRLNVGLGSKVTIKNSEISNNSASSGQGGGIYSNNGSVEIDNVNFENNDAYSGGGAVIRCNDEDFECVIKNSTFKNNDAAYGGALKFADGGGFVANSTLVDNTANDEGEAITFDPGSDATVVNTRIIGHASSADASTLRVRGSNPEIVNTTISNNEGVTILNQEDAFPRIYNTVLWGNEGDEIMVSSGQPLVEHSVVQGGIPSGAVDNGGNIDQDPLFADPDGPDGVPGTKDDDLRLKGPPNTSPAIDAGSNDLMPADKADIDNDGDTSEQLPLDFHNNARSQNVTEGNGEVVDIGAHESDGSPLPVELVNLVVFPNENSALLQWQTESENENAGFQVQKWSSSHDQWVIMGFVKSKANGSIASEPKSYSYRVKELTVGTHQFRLKQIDLDGSSTLYGPVKVRIEMREPLKLTAPSPNPVSSTATLSFAVKEQSETTIRLYNTLGQKVATVYEGTPQAGERQRVQVDVSGLSSGTYFLRLRAKEKTRTRQVTVVR